MEHAKKAKAKASKKGAKKQEDEGTIDEQPSSIHQNSKMDSDDYDLFEPAGFANALKSKVPRPMIFGPIEFDGLNLTESEAPFDAEAVRG